MFSAEYREAYMSSLMTTLSDPKFMANMHGISTQLSSPHADNILEALKNITLLLDVCRVFPSTADRRTYYFVFDTIFSVVIGKFGDRYERVVYMLRMHTPFYCWTIVMYSHLSWMCCCVFYYWLLLLLFYCCCLYMYCFIFVF